MSNQQHTPGTGIHPEDLNALTEYWLRETNYINDKVDEAFKSAQDDAYSRGYRRGREDLIEIRKRRDELLAALEEALLMVPCGSMSDAKIAALAANGHLTAEMILRHRAIIARMKGGAA